MSITCEVLGLPGQDNALLVRVNNGQRISRLLFDCGESTVATLGFSEIQAIDHLFFSHLHMDHIGGFDTFFRATFGRGDRPNRIWGPPETATILQHRFRGFLWNLYQEEPATSWLVHDVYPDQIQTTRFELGEAFALAHTDGVQPLAGPRILPATDFTVSALAMDHNQTTSLAYVVRESPRRNVSPTRLAELGLPPGSWLQQVKDATPEQLAGGAEVEVDGRRFSLAQLQSELVLEQPGDSVAYLTDFRLDTAAVERLAPELTGCRIVVCECQYRNADLELAEKSYHMIPAQVALLAQRAEVERLVLFHLSTRYSPLMWQEMLVEARRGFASSFFPEHWQAARLDRRREDSQSPEES
jgi:ribonuclease Z